MENKVGVGIISGFICGGVGFVGGLILESTDTNSLAKARIFQEQGLPKVLRTYNELERDNLFIEDPNDCKEYISFKKHLDSIPNRYDRDIEEARIKNLLIGNINN